MSVRSIILIILSCGITIISMQNLNPSSLRIFFWNVELPLIVLIFFVLLGGFTIGYSAGTIQRGRHAKRESITRETADDDND